MTTDTTADAFKILRESGVMYPGTILELDVSAFPNEVQWAVATHLGAEPRHRYAAWTGSVHRFEAIMSATSNTHMSPSEGAAAVVALAVPGLELLLRPPTVTDPYSNADIFGTFRQLLDDGTDSNLTIDGADLWRLPGCGDHQFRGLTLREIANRLTGPRVTCSNPKHFESHAHTLNCIDPAASV